MASTGLRRTLSGNGNQYTATFSVWVKRTSTANDARIYTSWYDANNQGWITFTNNTVGFFVYQSSSYSVQVRTNRVFRDTNAWYHVLFAIDTTQSTAADRVKIYINGVQETSMAQTDYPNQNQSLPFGLASYNQRIGERSGDDYFEGIMSHFNFVDGTALTPSSFGETDSTTGEWTIKASPSVTYGSNGFFILKNSGSVTDQSGNSNNWTVNSGTLSNTEDCPDNNFATLNVLVRSSGGAFSQGCNTFTDTSGSYQSAFSSIGMFNGQGKYYAEFKVVSGTSLLFGIADKKLAGVIDRIEDGETRYLGEYANSYGYQRSGTFYYNGSSSSTGYDSFTTNDIIGLAVDMENLKIYWHKNGTYQNSKDPASNNGETIVAPDECYHMAVSVASSVANANFGNGTFGTTAISSEGTNASGHGKFEYNVPTGYTALCTKGINI